MFIVIFNNETYDIETFLEIHPGGKDLLLNFENKDITNIFYEIGHSNKAYEIIKLYRLTKK